MNLLYEDQLKAKMRYSYHIIKLEKPQNSGKSQ